MPTQRIASVQRRAGANGPSTSAPDRKFLARLRALGFDERQCNLLRGITEGAPVASTHRDSGADEFFKRVEEYGRSLAKLNVPPTKIAEALNEYVALLSERDRKLPEKERSDSTVARQRLFFDIMLAINQGYYQVRDVETRTLHEFFRIDLEARDNLDALYRRFLEVLAGAFGARAGHMYLFDRATDRWSQVARTGGPSKAPVEIPNSRGLDKRLSKPLQLSQSRPAEYLDPNWQRSYRSAWSFPMKSGDALAGVFQFGFDRELECLPRDEELMHAAGERCLVAGDRVRLLEHLAGREEQLRQAAERMLQVEEMERRKISRELHDDAGQSLVCIRLQMELIELSLPKDATEIGARLAEVRDVTEKTILGIRRLIADLSPVVMEQFGLDAAIRQPVKRLQANGPSSVKLTTHGLDKLPQRLKIIVYRIVQECCENIGRHSGASNVNISVTSADGVLRLEVKDDGCGFDVEEALKRTDTFGLAGIRERVALLGGKFAVNSVQKGNRRKPAGKKRGTEVNIELPLPENLLAK